MKLAIILHQGPFDGYFMSIHRATDGDWPTKIRVASGDNADDPLEVHQYRRHDVDEKGTIFMGSYVFTHSFESARSLVEFWV